MSKQVIIGSTALSKHYPDFKRKPSDLDIVVETKKENKNGVEYHLNPVLLEVEKEKHITPKNLLALKVSHMFWDNSWAKHMWDIHFLLSKGVEFDFNLYKRFRNYFEKVLPNIKRSELQMDKESFFTNKVNENTQQHDELHYMLNPVPMFTLLLKDGCEVELDESKWDSLTFEQKKDVVYEETIVMAVERYKGRWQHAYANQLKDNIIKHFPEYIALFSIFNYPKLEFKPNKYNIEPLLIKLNKHDKTRNYSLDKQ